MQRYIENRVIFLEKTIEDVIKRIAGYEPRADFELVRQAFKCAEQAHQGQTRKNGDPYIQHPLQVAKLLTEIEADSVTVCAALLHDVVEDTDISLKEIEDTFGVQIALLVDGVTKLNKLHFRSREEAQVENLRKMLLAMAKDIRVIIIKLADRLHNMRTLKYQPPPKQLTIAQETMDIYAPLAHRIGVFRFKWELEDRAFSYLEPEVYKSVAQKMNMRRDERENIITGLIRQISQLMKESEIKADIAGRNKNIYSIYKKMVKQGKDLDEIYDKEAIRIIVEEVRDCYGVLGMIHTMWKPLPGRFKDYIATPKSNMYQSLHTTLIGQKGEPFEVQIRTWEMHRISEYGIAAHWRYKEGVTSSTEYDKKLTWLRSILEWQQDVNDTQEFMESLKLDLFDDTVFIFTPEGDIVELVKGSCPVDFAYRVHTEVGNRCTGAKVNGRIVPLDHVLQTGDIVQILTAKNVVGPSRDWLVFVKTSTAKGRIKQWFKREQREENLIQGQAMMEKTLKKSELNTKEMMREAKLLEIAGKFNIKSLDELYIAIASGVTSVQQVVNKMIDLYYPDKKQEQQPVPALSGPALHAEDTNAALQIKGVDNIAIRLAQCCNPLPTDAVLGYVTRGRGVSVHRADCSIILNSMKTEKERLIPVEWVTEKGVFVVEFEISAMDRDRLTLDIMNLLADMKVPVYSVFSRSAKHGHAVVNVKVEIKNLQQMELISAKILRIRDITGIHRI
jgi:GTP pyrophosphokinase